jgi:hypothetical protein
MLIKIDSQEYYKTCESGGCADGTNGAVEQKLNLSAHNIPLLSSLELGP